MGKDVHSILRWARAMRVIQIDLIWNKVLLLPIRNKILFHRISSYLVKIRFCSIIVDCASWIVFGSLHVLKNHCLSAYTFQKIEANLLAGVGAKDAIVAFKNWGGDFGRYSYCGGKNIYSACIGRRDHSSTFTS